MGRVKASDAVAKAKEEVAEEDLKKAVRLLKDKYREQREAEVVLENIKREIEDLEEAIEDGNF